MLASDTASNVLNPAVLWLQRCCCRLIRYNATSIYSMGTTIDHEKIAAKI